MQRFLLLVQASRLDLFMFAMSNCSVQQYTEIMAGPGVMPGQ